MRFRLREPNHEKRSKHEKTKTPKRQLDVHASPLIPFCDLSKGVFSARPPRLMRSNAPPLRGPLRPLGGGAAPGRRRRRRRRPGRHAPGAPGERSGAERGGSRSLGVAGDGSPCAEAKRPRHNALGVGQRDWQSEADGAGSASRALAAL